MTARPRPPIPYDFLPEVPSFEVTSDDIADGGTLADAHVQAEGNTSPHLRYLGPTRPRRRRRSGSTSPRTPWRGR